MTPTHEELMAAAGRPTVPGTPLTLQLGGWCETPGEVPRISWHFDDPRWPGEIVEGVTAVRGPAEQVWADVQLDAAWVLHNATDGDWTPGVAPTRRRWGTEDAWRALLDHLGREGRLATVSGDEVRGAHLTLRGVTPETWAAYLSSVDDGDQEERQDGDRDVVPVGRIEGDGLPLWADDELTWGHGDAPVLDLVDGELVDPRTPEKRADPGAGVELPGGGEAWLRPQESPEGDVLYEFTVLVPDGDRLREVAWAEGTADEVREVLDEHPVAEVYLLEHVRQVEDWRRFASFDDLERRGSDEETTGPESNARLGSRHVVERDHHRPW